MNVLSEISGELAVAILLNKKRAEKIDSKEGAELIEKVFDILEPISHSREDANLKKASAQSKSASH